MTDPIGPNYGETWVYESIIGAIPGITLSRRAALALQLVGFEGTLLVLAWYYDLWTAAVPGTVAILVATAGSVGMLRISEAVRRADTPEPYRRVLFGSSIELVLSLVAFIALVTYLFVADPRSGESLVTTLLGAEPPIVAVFFALLVLWDLCYRIGTGWWASVVAVWRSSQYRFDERSRRILRRADLETALFGGIQLCLVPFVLDHPLLLVAIVGHVIAVAIVIAVSRWLLISGQSRETEL